MVFLKLSPQMNNKAAVYFIQYFVNDTISFNLKIQDNSILMQTIKVVISKTEIISKQKK